MTGRRILNFSGLYPNSWRNVMLLELALATAIHKANPKLRPETTQKWATVVVQESEDKGLDPWLFFAIIRHESWWVPSVIHHERGGACDVGLGQILIARCRRGDVLPLLDPVTNLRRSAQIQKIGMDYCQTHVCTKGWLFLYNHSQTYVRLVNKEAEEARNEFEVRPADPPPH
jgi:hypothetical protein